MRRHKFQIVADILKACEKPKIFTELLHDGKVSYFQLKKYLRLSVNHGLVRERVIQNPHARSRFTYEITKKGERFVKKVNELNKLLGWSF